MTPRVLGGDCLFTCKHFITWIDKIIVLVNIEIVPCLFTVACSANYSLSYSLFLDSSLIKKLFSVWLSDVNPCLPRCWLLDCRNNQKLLQPHNITVTHQLKQLKKSKRPNSPRRKKKVTSATYRRKQHPHQCWGSKPLTSWSNEAT